MPKKKNNIDDEVIEKKKGVKENSDEEPVMGEDGVIDPAIIEDTFTEEFGEYNDVDNF
jgi:hypothetical protein